MNQSIIIVGAGASGLMAAAELAQAGQQVTVLEAAARTGGRMYTAICDGFEQPLELGAEFVHGKLPVTLGLLKEAKIAYTPVKGKMLQHRNGAWNTQDEIIPDWDGIMKKMFALKEDMTLAEFLQQHYSDDKHLTLRSAIQSFAEGFDLADPTQASVFGLRDEWSHEEETQYRITGGYRKLAEYLTHLIEKHGGKIYHNAAVTKVNWQANQVKVETENGQQFDAEKIILTVSPHILQSVKIDFEPAIDGSIHNMSQIGFGSVIKIFLQFEEPFWQEHEDNTGFVISDQNIPTWWTQSDKNNYLLTGWFGGPKVMPHITSTEVELITLAMESLAAIYNIPIEKLQSILLASKAIHWTNEEWSMGAYSYDTLHTAIARQLLQQPIDSTIFFAGEAMYVGPSTGTVEAALVSGKEVAQKVLRA